MALVRLENIISAKNVASRWGIDSWTLGEITRHDRIYVYQRKDTRQLPDGRKIHLCNGPYAQGMPYEEDFGTRVYDLSMYIFDLGDIEKYEIQHPEYLLPRVAEDEPEYIPAGSLRKEMGLSPVQFVDYLREYRDLALSGNGIDGVGRNWFYHGTSREDAAGMLDDMYIHRLDIAAHKKHLEDEAAMSDVPFSPADNNPASKKQSVHITELETQLAEAQKQIKEFGNIQWWKNYLNKQNQELSSKLAEKDARITELEAKLAIPVDVTTVNAVKWENTVKAAFGVWANIVLENKTDWKENEFRAALASRYNDYHTDVHAIAWRLLPEAFKHGRGRPKKNPEKSQQSDNS